MKLSYNNIYISMKKTFIILSLFLILSCQKSQTLKGDLYFKLVNVISPTGFNEAQVSKIKKTLDTIDLNKIKDVNLKKMYQNLEQLQKHKLLQSPSIKIKVVEKDIQTVYLSKIIYQKIEKYSLDYLTINKTKLQVELKVKELEKDLYYSEEILSLKEVQGQTYFDK